MELNGKKVILASGSPRRRELLAGLQIDFEVDTCNNFIESYSLDTPHRQIPMLMSEGKSNGFHRPLEQDEILLTSDTLVLCGSEVMGKPKDREDAIRMLQTLSGSLREGQEVTAGETAEGAWHEVITAVTVRTADWQKTVSDTTRVHFRQLTDEEIRYYVDKYKPFDKAGAYGVQEWIGYMGIDRIEGSFYTVMGLPCHIAYSLLQEAATE